MNIPKAILPFTINKLMKSYDVIPKFHTRWTDASASRLEELVKRYSFFRHYTINPEDNYKACKYIFDDFSKVCSNVEIIDNCRNVVAEWEGEGPKITITGHYDSPPYSIGADDNASAIATMIHLAELFAVEKPLNLRFVAFNREEEGILGSKEFCKKYDLSKISHVLNLEMVGYYTKDSGTQQMPEGFPAFDVGNFLAIVGNNNSGKILANLIKVAKKEEINLPIKGINVPMGLEFKIPSLNHLLRSDHLRFWEREIPAVMITDTSEFRNHHYHRESDLPDTLNYDSMANLVDLLYNYVKL